MADEKKDQEPPSPWLQTGFLLSAAMVLLIVVGGVVLLVKPPAQSAPIAPLPSAVTSGPAPTGCAAAGLVAVPFSKGEVQTAPPAGTTWSPTEYSSVPAVKGIGPAIIDGDGYRHCYAQSLDGATLAAANYVAQVIDPVLWEKVIRQGSVVRKDTEDQIDQMKAKGGANTTHAKMMVVGVNAVRATSDTSVDVGLVVTYNGTPTSMTFPMLWDGSDWLLQPPPDTSAIVADYTPWGK